MVAQHLLSRLPGSQG